MAVKCLLMTIVAFLSVGISNSNEISPGVLIEVLIEEPNVLNASINIDKLIFAHVVSEYFKYFIAHFYIKTINSTAVQTWC